MMNKNRNRESGQAIVLIAFAFIGLVGFAALAIDGSMVYSDRRHAQNATDSGSLSGGGAGALHLENANVIYADFTCGSTDVNTAITLAENTAQNLMLANGYNTADFSISTDCQDGDSNYFEDKYLDINTQIITETQTAFVQVVYDQPIQNLVNATTRIRPRVPLAFGHAIVGLNPGDGACSATVEGVKLGGTGDVDIIGGGIWSQSCLAVIGDCHVDVGGGGVSYGFGTHGSCSDLSPAPQPQNETLDADDFTVPEPTVEDCNGSGAVTITDIKLTNPTSEVNLNTAYPGANLICLTSSGNAIQISNGVLTGTHVTIYLQNRGDIRITGGTVNLSAPAADPDPDPGIPGVIFYVPDDPNTDVPYEPYSDTPNLSVIKINGTNESSYLGLIYAPESEIEIEGSGDIGPTLNTQVVGYDVSLLGNATIDINFNESWNYTKPTALDLQE